jgi:nicotinate-nucleotide adenylyltransferase
MQRVGVFSGTFDPFHKGHLEACLVAKSVLELDSIIILIEKFPHRKSDVTAYKHRFEMADISIQKYPSLRLVDSGNNNITTSITLGLLEQIHPGAEYWFILGSDMLEHIGQWKDADKLFANFNFCVVLRNNQMQNWAEQKIDGLKKQYPKTQFKILPAVWSDVSSSSVKQELRSGIRKNIDPLAGNYAIANKLYS